jgi:diguanylate cyclase (GGDEF)-like protein/PAS domain S-box-containing protein
MALRRPPLWAAYLALGAVLCALYACVAPFAGSAPLMNLIGFTPVAAILLAIRRHRPASVAPWWCFAIGWALFFCGDLYTYSYPRLLGKEVPFPSMGDGAYLLVYPALMAGLVLLVRRRSPEGDRAGAIDSLIMTLGLALISWVALIAPNLHADLGPLGKAVSVAYPLGDVLLLAAAIRLAVDTGRRQPSFYFLAASLVSLLVTDFAYGLVTLHGDYHGQVALDVGWIAAYLLWGAAALHPSMRDLERATPGREARLTPLRLGLLTAASLIAPALEVSQELHDGNRDALVVVAASVVLFGLVVARMAGLVRQHERSVARQRILTAAGADLVAATRPEELSRAALHAARALAGSGSAVLLCLVEDGGLVVAASEGEAARAGRRLARAAAAELLAGEEDGTLEPPLLDALGLAPQAGPAVALPLGVRGVLVAAGECLRGRGERAALGTLASQVALALESADLTREVHRRTSEARFGSLVQHASDLITVLDAEGRIVYQSPSVERVLGWSPRALVGERFARLLTPIAQRRLAQLLARAGAGEPGPGAATQVLECALRHRDGGVRHFEILHTDLLHDELVRGIVLNGRDVSERRAVEEQLAHQAFHDPVCDLANRALFADRVRHALARAARDGERVAVAFLDLDDFKTINDSLGHAAGDEVLRGVAERLRGCLRASDTAARFGGDEFAVLLEGLEGAGDAVEAVERVLGALAEPLRVEAKELVVRTSVGLALAEGEEGADELLRNADVAMYIAKREGGGGLRLFEPAMHAGALERLQLRADLQQAMATHQLELHYQPIVSLAEGEVRGLEALLRWRHPERGLLPPDVFVPLAEEMGLIVPIGRWVLEEGCRRARALQDVLPPSEPPLYLSVNLSVKQLLRSDIVADVARALDGSGLDPACLTLEITETAMMTDSDAAVRRLHELKALGVRLAMDDFGTGYSSLSYLSRFPVDVLKMDRSFLRADAGADAGNLASAVVALGATLALEVVAEGIEDPAQWERMRDLGCDLGQGFYFARPMDPLQVEAFLADAAAGVTVDAP